MTSRFSQPPVEPADFHHVLGHFPTGVTIVTAAVGKTPVGVAIGSFVSISLDPPLVGFFLGNESTSAPGLQEAGSFCVNVLAHDQLELCGTMASKASDKFSGWPWTPAPGSGSPVFEGIHAYIDCALDDTITVGDHDLYVGRVLALDTVESVDPMVFYQGRYGTVGSVG